MRIVIQRVTSAEVTVDGSVTGKIGKGLLIFFGAGVEDAEDPHIINKIEKSAAKIYKMRIFSDENGKINLSLGDVGGEVLIVSQFTLYADCSHGNRPSFVNACPSQRAEELYKLFISEFEKYLPNVQTGIFGADMKISLLNDGPFTIVL